MKSIKARDTKQLTAGPVAKVAEVEPAPSFDAHETAVLVPATVGCLHIIKSFVSLSPGLSKEHVASGIVLGVALGYSHEDDSPCPPGRDSVGHTSHPEVSPMGLQLLMCATLMSPPAFAPSSWPAEDRETAFKDICDNPRSAPRGKGIYCSRVHGKKTLAGGSRDPF